MDAQATLVDQFQDWGGLALDPFLLCNPADKNGEGIVNVDDHLACYTVTPIGESVGSVLILNQFYDDQSINVLEPFGLCVPSAKALPEPGALLSLVTGLLGLAGLDRWRKHGRRQRPEM